MHHILSVALTAGLGQGLMAADFEVSGRQEIQVILNSATSTVFTTTFTLTCVGTNWAISNCYTNSGMHECIALVEGRSYTAEWYGGGSSCGGLVMDRPSDRLEGATEFVRVLVGAFLTSKSSAGSVSNTPVGFLHPRHPGLYCYRQEIDWSSEAPGLPDRVQFHLENGLCEKVSRQDISYFFRSGYRDRSLFRRWQETQTSGAEYLVQAWTNWGGLTLPQRAKLTHTHHEHEGAERSFRRVHFITVTNVQHPASATLVPKLLPGASVQEVAGGICYLYTSADGRFLPVGQAKQVGTVLTTPATPRAVTALAWIWSLPGRERLWIAAVLLLVAGAGVLVVLIWRMLASRG